MNCDVAYALGKSDYPLFPSESSESFPALDSILILQPQVLLLIVLEIKILSIATLCWNNKYESLRVLGLCCCSETHPARIGICCGC